jgi:hypothetical protein
MPIEIRELVIKTDVVSQQKKNTQNTAGVNANQVRMLVEKECKEYFKEQERKKMYRR